MRRSSATSRIGRLVTMALLASAVLFTCKSKRSGDGDGSQAQSIGGRHVIRGIECHEFGLAPEKQGVVKRRTCRTMVWMMHDQKTDSQCWYATSIPVTELLEAKIGGVTVDERYSLFGITKDEMDSLVLREEQLRYRYKQLTRHREPVPGIEMFRSEEEIGELIEVKKTLPIVRDELKAKIAQFDRELGPLLEFEFGVIHSGRVKPIFTHYTSRGVIDQAIQARIDRLDPETLQYEVNDDYRNLSARQWLDVAAKGTVVVAGMAMMAACTYYSASIFAGACAKAIGPYFVFDGSIEMTNALNQRIVPNRLQFFNLIHELERRAIVALMTALHEVKASLNTGAGPAGARCPTLANASFDAP